MCVSGGPEGDKDGGASGGRYPRDSDGARPANDQVGLGKPLRHIFDEGDDLRVELASRISHANRIIVAFTGLMHDEKLIFSGCQAVERINHRAVDRQGTAAAAGDQQLEWRAMLLRRHAEELPADWDAGDHGFAAE